MALFAALQKEVLALKQDVRERERLLKDKDLVVEMGLAKVAQAEKWQVGTTLVNTRNSHAPFALRSERRERQQLPNTAGDGCCGPRSGGSSTCEARWAGVQWSS